MKRQLHLRKAEKAKLHKGINKGGRRKKIFHVITFDFQQVWPLPKPKCDNYKQAYKQARNKHKQCLGNVRREYYSNQIQNFQ